MGTDGGGAFCANRLSVWQVDRKFCKDLKFTSIELARRHHSGTRWRKAG